MRQQHEWEQQQQQQQLGGGFSSSPLTPLLAVSNEVIEEQEIAGVGRFRAFADGRVRAAFPDRTILTLAPSAGAGDLRQSGDATARLILPDGRRAVVSARNPLGCEDYVAAAVRFADWAFLPPGARGALLAARLAVQAELRATARAAALCDYAASGRLPAEALAAAARAAAAAAADEAADACDDVGDEWGAAAAAEAADGAQGGAAACADGNGAAPWPGPAAAAAERQRAVEAMLSTNRALIARLG